MKALTENSKHFLSFYKFNQQPRWKQLRKSLTTSGCGLPSWLSLAGLRSVFCSLAALSKKMILRLVHAPVVRVLRAILAWMQPLVSSAILNNRFYVGLVLVVIVGPLSACVQMLPGMKTLVSKDWYYESYYNLYLVLGPYFYCLCIALTFSLWLPPIPKRIKWSKKSITFQLSRAISIPLGLTIAKIVWLIFCDSNQDFERLPDIQYLAGGLVVGYVVIRFLDYLVWRQEHAMNALIDSLEGLYSLDIDPKERTEMAKAYWKELREFHSKY